MTINLAQYPGRIAAMIRLLLQHRDDIAASPQGRRVIFNLGPKDVEIELTLKQRLPHE